MIKLCPLILLLFLSAFTFGQRIRVTHLRTESRINPIGIETTLPRFSWEIQSNQRNVMQTAYRILVADDSHLLQKDSGNVWDTKKTASNASIQVSYAGNKLVPVKTYYWKIRIWDNHKNASSWSRTAIWQMGLLTHEDWKGAQWIAYNKLADSLITILPTDGKKDTYTGNNILPLLRKEFAVNKPVKKATMFICGLGQFELHLNGGKVGDHFLDPGWTKYDRQALYVAFNLTNQVKNGMNAIGVMLGNGFYYVPPVKGRYRKLKTAFGFPKMICRLVIEFKDGTIENILSDSTWKVAPGPIIFSSLYGGEDYDATQEHRGWDRPAFDDRDWQAAIKVNGPPQLNAQMEESVKVFEHFLPKKITQLNKSTWVYDLGQNASGIIHIKVRGDRGDTIKIVPAELLKENGTVNQKATGSPYYFEYILRGGTYELWQPRFTYYGFRYVQVEVKKRKGVLPLKKLPQIIQLEGWHIRNSASRAGSFVCSNNLFNRIDTLITWAIKSNMVSLFTDCPHREKLGWLEEAHLMGPSIRYNFDIAHLCRQEIDDIRFSQDSTGLVPEIAPEYVKFEWGGGMFRDSPEWGSSSILLPWYLYLWYGDKQVVEQSYTTMQRYIEYLERKAKNHILYQGLGDWYDLGPKPPGVSQLTPMGVTGTAIYYYDLNILSSAARLLNKPLDAVHYEEIAAEVKKAFNEVFFNKVTKQYATGSQTANAMAVYMDLVAPEYRDSVVENIIKDICRRNNCLTAGDIGYYYLLKVLDNEGRSDVIFDMNCRSDVPGYGYQLTKGATSLTESWQAYSTASNNHLMLGHIMEWFYCALGGIRPAAQSIGFDRIDIRPEPVGNVTFAKASYHSPYGLISTWWKKGSHSFQLKVSIPANTSATIYLPADKEARILESNKPLQDREGITFLRRDKEKALIKVGSGNYQFEVLSNNKKSVEVALNLSGK